MVQFRLCCERMQFMPQMFVSLISNTESVVNCNMPLSRTTSFRLEGQSALMEKQCNDPKGEGYTGTSLLEEVDLENWAFFTFPWMIGVVFLDVHSWATLISSGQSTGSCKTPEWRPYFDHLFPYKIISPTDCMKSPDLLAQQQIKLVVYPFSLGAAVILIRYQ